MPDVILPLGYPIHQGAEFESLIYYGKLVRKYSIPNDPRTSAQIFQRYFFKDIHGILGTMGKMPRAMLKAMVSTRWNTVYFQYLKADPEGRVAAVLNEYPGYSEQFKEELRSTSPFLATYNDPGLIWAVVVYSLPYLTYIYSDWHKDNGSITDRMTWGIDDLGDPTLSAFNTWWFSDAPTGAGKGTTAEGDALWNYYFPWTLYNDASARGGEYRQSPASSGYYCETFWRGRALKYFYVKKPGLGSANFYIDGKLIDGVNMASGSNLYGQYWTSPLTFLGTHLLQVVAVGGAITNDGIDVVISASGYQP